MRIGTMTFLALSVLMLECSGLRFSGSFRSGMQDWTMLGGSTSRTNVSASSVRPPFKFLWEYNAQGGIAAQPLLRDSVIVVATLHGEVQAIHVRTGKRMGYENVGGPVQGTPVLDGVRVIVPVSTLSNSLLSLDLQSGGIVWSSKLGPIESSPVVLENRVIVSTLEGRVVCLQKSNGEEVWRFSPKNDRERKPIRSAPTVGGGLVICGSDDGILYAIDAVTGVQRWSRQMTGSIFAAPIVADSIVVVGDIKGQFASYDISTGQPRWSLNTHEAIYAAAAYDGERIFVGTSGGSVIAVLAKNGETVWTNRVPSVVNAAPFVCGDLVYVGSLDKFVRALDRTTGTQVWSTELAGRVKVSLVAWGDILLITYEDKFIAAYRSVPAGT